MTPDGQALATVGILFPILATAVVGLRFYARRRTGVSCEASDWLALAGLLMLYWPNFVMVWAAFGAGYGQRFDEVTPQTAVLHSKAALTTTIGWQFSIVIIKCSVLLLFRQAFASPGYRRFVNVWLAVSVAWVIVNLPPLILVFTPFDGHIPGSGPQRFNETGYLLVWEIGNILVDVITFYSPIFVLRSLRAPKEKHLMVMTILLLGFVGVIASIIRLAYRIMSLEAFADLPGDAASMMRSIVMDEILTRYAVWFLLEIDLVLIVACIPVVGKLLSPVFVSSGANSSSTNLTPWRATEPTSDIEHRKDPFNHSTVMNDISADQKSRNKESSLFRQSSNSNDSDGECPVQAFVRHPSLILGGSGRRNRTRKRVDSFDAGGEWARPSKYLEDDVLSYEDDSYESSRTKHDGGGGGGGGSSSENRRHTWYQLQLQNDLGLGGFNMERYGSAVFATTTRREDYEQHTAEKSLEAAVTGTLPREEATRKAAEARKEEDDAARNVSVVGPLPTIHTSTPFTPFNPLTPSSPSTSSSQSSPISATAKRPFSGALSRTLSKSKRHTLTLTTADTEGAGNSMDNTSPSSPAIAAAAAAGAAGAAPARHSYIHVEKSWEVITEEMDPRARR